MQIHELSSGAGGKYHEIKNYVKHMDQQYEKMAEDYVKFTGQTLNKIKKDMKMDYFMSAEEAKEYGLIDEIQHVME